MSDKVIKALNEARAAELAAITQYMAHHYELDDMDYGKLGAMLKEISIDEMKHAEELAERILYLGGDPTYKPDAATKKGMGVLEMVEFDLALENGAIEMYNNSIKLCRDEKDNVSLKIFEELIAEEQEHADKFENVRDHIKNLGDAYLVTLIE